MAKVLGYVQVKAPAEPARIKKTAMKAEEKGRLRQIAERLAEKESLPFPFVDSECVVYNGGNSLGLSCNGIEVNGAKKGETLREDFPRLYGISEKEFYGMVTESKKSWEGFKKQEKARIENLRDFLSTSLSPKEQSGFAKGKLGALEVYAKLSKAKPLRDSYGKDSRKALHMLDYDIDCIKNGFYRRGAIS